MALPAAGLMAALAAEPLAEAVTPQPRRVAVAPMVQTIFPARAGVLAVLRPVGLKQGLLVPAVAAEAGVVVPLLVTAMAALAALADRELNGIQPMAVAVAVAQAVKVTVQVSLALVALVDCMEQAAREER